MRTGIYSRYLVKTIEKMVSYIYVKLLTVPYAVRAAYLRHSHVMYIPLGFYAAGAVIKIQDHQKCSSHKGRNVQYKLVTVQLGANKTNL
jgi:hypothetical protein